MPGSDFEKKVQQSMEELKLSPSAAVWDGVEAALPEKRKRRWLIFLLIFAALFTGAGLLWMNHGHEQSKLRVNKDTEKQQTNTDLSVSHPSAPSSPVISNGEKDTISSMPDLKIQSNTSLNYSHVVKRSTNKNIRINITNPVDNSAVHLPSLRSKTKSAITIDPAGTDAVDSTPAIISSVQSKTFIALIAGDTDTSVITKTGKEKIKTEKKSSIIKTDSSKTETVVKKERKKEKLSSWQWGVEAGAGISNSAKNILGSSPLYSSGLSQGVPPSSSPASTATAPGLSFKLGLSASKKISKNWTFKTGIGYAYFSNRQEAGTRVDTGSLATISGNYYRNDNSSRYVNHYHLAEIPFIFRVDIIKQKKHSFFLEAGPGLAYLISSNALMYRPSYNIFVNGTGEFNHLLMNVQAGAGVRFAQKTKKSFSIGFRAQYNITPVFKNSETSAQHPVSALLMLQVPFRK